ncbi:hypothetical protein DFP72DRAFT_850254 [Ephemerocybe angulata]|uniref:Uncharacterized protein n=1 Tax=Ephemerocybe angulata TaxID=980116 RepID=A0A8H6M1J8_9AGAR|nr:hypothetical protein DFP72DRAFT_850254 [Tulosesus angulatus]
MVERAGEANSNEGTISPEKARKEYLRVRNLPSRKDFFTRLYYNLKPSHRVATKEYRCRSGVILPFGADTPPAIRSRIRLCSDLAMPVVSKGKAWGANPEDLYGCLYFFLTQELREFHRRLQRFHIAFKITCMDASGLSQLLLNTQLDVFAKYDLPASTRFDRIMPDGRYDGLSRAAEDRILAKLTSKYKASLNPQDSRGINDWISMSDEAHLLYGNAKPFAAYLKKQGLESVLREARLTLRETNTIVPPRLGVAINASKNALPNIPDDDARYLNLRVTGSTWGERFVEFSRKSAKEIRSGVGYNEEQETPRQVAVRTVWYMFRRV